MDSKEHDIGDHSEVELPGKRDFESDKAKNMQSDSLEAINNSGDEFENNTILKDISCKTEDGNNFVCETMQSERAHKSTESLETDHKGTEIDANKTSEILKEISTIINSIDTSKATTSQDNSSSSCCSKESSTLSSDQKVKRGISRGQIQADNDISMEKSDDSSDEDSSKRQKLNESTHGTENLVKNMVTFQKTDSKVKQRNYRKRRSVTSDNEDSSESLLNEVVGRPSLLDNDEGNCSCFFFFYFLSYKQDF